MDGELDAPATGQVASPGRPRDPGAMARRRRMLRRLWVALALAALLLGWMLKLSARLDVGESRWMTAHVGSCQSLSIEIHDRTLHSLSGEKIPALWGAGPVEGTLTRITEREAVFTHPSGHRVRMSGSPGGEFRTLGCSIGG